MGQQLDGGDEHGQDGATAERQQGHQARGESGGREGGPGGAPCRGRRGFEIIR